MVETTNWEDRHEKQVAAAAAASLAESGQPAKQQGGWLHSWRERELSQDGQYREH